MGVSDDERNSEADCEFSAFRDVQYSSDACIHSAVINIIHDMLNTLGIGGQVGLIREKSIDAIKANIWVVLVSDVPIGAIVV